MNIKKEKWHPVGISWAFWNNLWPESTTPSCEHQLVSLYIPPFGHRKREHASRIQAPRKTDSRFHEDTICHPRGPLIGWQTWAVFNKPVYSKIGCFVFFPVRKDKKKEEKKTELVWLCIGFLCVVASINPPCGLVSVWKHRSACGKRCAGGNVDHTPTKTQDLSNRTFLSPKPHFFFILVRDLILFLSNFVIDQVWK